MKSKIEKLEDVAGTLEELWLSYNQITSLDGLSGLSQLTTLYISNNLIKGWNELDKLVSALHYRVLLRCKIVSYAPLLQSFLLKKIFFLVEINCQSYKRASSIPQWECPWGCNTQFYRMYKCIILGDHYFISCIYFFNSSQSHHDFFWLIILHTSLSQMTNITHSYAYSRRVVLQIWGMYYLLVILFTMTCRRSKRGLRYRTFRSQNRTEQ